MKNIFVIFLFLTLFSSEVVIEILTINGHDIVMVELPFESEIENETTDNLKLEFEVKILPSDSPVHNSDLSLGDKYSFSFLLPDPTLELLTPPPEHC